jgi:hypothetical protein
MQVELVLYQLAQVGTIAETVPLQNVAYSPCGYNVVPDTNAIGAPFNGVSAMSGLQSLHVGKTHTCTYLYVLTGTGQSAPTVTEYPPSEYIITSALVQHCSGYCAWP